MSYNVSFIEFFFFFFFFFSRNFNRPYSKDMGYEDLNVSALLSVRLVRSYTVLFPFQIIFHVMSLFLSLVYRCLPGYPYKCPKLQITPENGLSKSDADKLQSLLQDQVCVHFIPVFLRSVKNSVVVEIITNPIFTFLF
jgi:hypothetical protein